MRMLGLLQPTEPASASIGHWTVRELYTPNVHEDVHTGLGSYQVVLEAEVDSPAEVEDRFSEGLRLLSSWSTCGSMPLGQRSTGMGSRWLLRISNLPAGGEAT